ncbi:hypothetical protein DZG00_06050 [Clavibacter lycopersici]|uniref:Uncharacterized protein n=1 Tax=Clavibacter lycopersici TaxID=2301718 RepID=A0A399TCZ8_9MICO|nr:hypothetical protein [Clavibacter lycopersici]RIJ52167.1 hypothetical protein DZG00_06050 [Clavibacter lycopersici]RIJ61270.1 hypothetical protein DZG02_07860 [Clavibacter lycopersici]
MGDAADAPGKDADAVVDFVRALVTPPWPRDAADAERMLAALGVHPTGGVDAWSPSSAQHALTGGPDAVDHLSYGVHADSVSGIGFFLARHGGARDPLVRRDHDALVAALAALFGPPRAAFDDQSSPVLWDVAELQVGVQLFDRVDSSVMVDVDHSDRSARAEAEAAAAGDDPGRG